MDVHRLWPVILSGGAGTRLWPLSRARHPKQLLKLGGARTLFEDTALRGVEMAAMPPLIVCGAAHAVAITEQLAEIAIVGATLIIEPCARNTAPAVMLAAAAIAARGRPDDLMLVMPSDHAIADPLAFAAAVTRARPVAEAGWLVTLGIAPTAPETGYGYIAVGAAIADGVHAAERFVEKPARAAAEAMLADGGYAWNGGIFLFRADTLLTAMATHAPDVHAAVLQSLIGIDDASDTIHPDAAAFAASPSISLDYAVMEHAARVAVVPVAMGWSDIGSWDSLYAHAATDEAANVVSGSGRVETVDAIGNLLHADGITLAAIGVTGLRIVATPDAVLVTAAGSSQAVKQITTRLAGDPTLERPVVTAKPWGSERIVDDGAGIAVRIIDIVPGGHWTGTPTTRVILIAGAAKADGRDALAAGALQPARAVSSTDGARLLVIES